MRCFLFEDFQKISLFLFTTNARSAVEEHSFQRDTTVPEQSA